MKMRWVGNIEYVVERRVAYGDLVVNPEGQSPLGKPRRRWEDNNKF
jgi:hypothetical protein